MWSIPPRAVPAHAGHDHVVPHRERRHDAALLAVLCQEGQTRGDGVARRPDAHRLAVHHDLAGVHLGDPEDGLQHLRASGAHEARETQDLTPMQLEGDVVDDAAPGEPLHRHDHLADLGGRLGEHLGELPADHQRDELLAVELGSSQGGDMLAVAEHRDPIRDPEHLVHLVGDVDDRDAALAERADHAVEVLHLTLGDGRCRLVHDDEPRVVGDGLGDLDHLGLGDAQRLHDPVGVQVDLPTGQEILRLG